MKKGEWGSVHRDLKKVEKSEVEILENGCEQTTSYVRYDNGEWLAQSVTTSDFLGRTAPAQEPGLMAQC